MRVYWNLDKNIFVSSPGSPAALTRVRMIRSDGFAVELVLLRSDLPVIEVATADQIGVVLKPTPAYDGASYMPTVVWTRDEPNKVFTAPFNFVNETLDPLFFVDGDPENDKAKLDLTLGFAYKPDGSTKWTPSPPLPLELLNNKFRGDEASAVVRSGGIFKPLIVTGLTRGEGKLDGIVTAPLPLPTFFSVYFDDATPDKLQDWILLAGTAATGPGIQRTTDYADGTNEKVLFRLR